MSLETKIKEWLGKQGYPLEMMVAREFQKNGFSVKLSTYYKDPDESRYREIDIVASRAQDINGTIIDISFVIECKFSPSKPWLIFKNKHDTDFDKENEIGFRASNQSGSVALLALSINEKTKDNYLFKLEDSIGYGVTRALENEKDMPYKAMHSACKASNALALEIDESWNKNQINSADIFFPMIVVDGKLFNCILNEDNETELSETEKETVIFRNPTGGKSHSFVDILTKEAVIDHAKYLSQAVDDVFHEIEYNCEGFFKYVNNSNKKA